MNFTMPLFSVAFPEIGLLIMAGLILLVDVFCQKKMLTFALAQISLVALFLLLIYQFTLLSTPISTFSGHYILDKLAVILKLFIVLASFFAFVYARIYNSERNIAAGDFTVLGLFAILGMLIMASANSLLTIYLGLELLSLPLYAMVALQKESELATEAAMKYFIMGAFASGLLLYGISMLYGATGSIQINDIAHVLMGATQGQNLVATFGMVFVLVGLIFKFGAVPFHMWVPDVYHGAPTSMTLFIASAPKIAAFGITMRILAQALPTLQVQWIQILIVIAVLSMFFGNVLAIAQTNVKRMLAYSSIAHIGYMLLGIIAGPHSSGGYSAALFYVLTYVLVAAGGFAIIAILSRKGIELDKITDFRGLNARSPWLAFMMLLLLFSMAGIPPTVGFFAKLGLLEALVEAHLVWLSCLALFFSIIGAYYYLRMIKVMYFEEPAANAEKIKLAPDVFLAITLNGGFVLVLGILPSSLIDLCRISIG